MNESRPESSTAFLSDAELKGVEVFGGFKVSVASEILDSLDVVMKQRDSHSFPFQGSLSRFMSAWAVSLTSETAILNIAVQA